MSEQSQGLAKSSETQVIEPPVHKTPDAIHSQMAWEGVPVEVYRYFGVDVGKADGRDIDQLKYIYQLASKDSDGDINKTLHQINQWEIKVGAPRITETVYSKIWNYVKIQDHINRLLKQQDIFTRR
jgi:hypothetical protein